MPDLRDEVPVRTIATFIGMVLATGATVWFVVQISRVLVWLVIAVFFAIVLAPIVGYLQQRARMPRPLAALTALLVVCAVIAGIVAVLVRPFVVQAQEVIDKLPGYVRQVQSGEGPLGGLLRRFDVLQRIQENQQRITGAIQQLGDPALNIVLTAGTVVVGILVVLVLTFLLVLEGPRLTDMAVGLLPPRHRGRARRVMSDASRAVTGYVGGQLLIATLCGGVTYVVLSILGVPFANVVALFVGLVDLIPVVGATIGGLVAVGVSFLHSIAAGIIMIVFILVYQQIENHLLQPFIQSRTVHMNALAVLVSVLIGVELAGILGALLAIPAAGILQVVARDMWSHRQGRQAAIELDTGEELQYGAGAPASEAHGVGSPVAEGAEPTAVESVSSPEATGKAEPDQPASATGPAGESEGVGDARTPRGDVTASRDAEPGENTGERTPRG